MWDTRWICNCYPRTTPAIIYHPYVRVNLFKKSGDVLICSEYREGEWTLQFLMINTTEYFFPKMKQKDFNDTLGGVSRGPTLMDILSASGRRLRRQNATSSFDSLLGKKNGMFGFTSLAQSLAESSLLSLYILKFMRRNGDRFIYWIYTLAFRHFSYKVGYSYSQ